MALGYVALHPVKPRSVGAHMDLFIQDAERHIQPVQQPAVLNSDAWFASYRKLREVPDGGKRLGKPCTHKAWGGHQDR